MISLARPTRRIGNLASRKHGKKYHTSVSYEKGSTEIPLIDRPIGDFLQEKTEAHRRQEILRVIHQDVRWTWDQLDERVDEFIAGMKLLGIKKGDRLGVWLPNTAEWVVLEFATAKTGVVLVNINPAYRTHELEHALNLVGCKALVLTQQLKTSNYIDLLKQIAPELGHDGSKHLRSKRLPSGGKTGIHHCACDSNIPSR
eukprot:TRINITY_DN2632_c0_g1_i6.p1 TRINITY_DN2632_c0_g1~~TRINITY_DN2632_c0_g1_i6.p1  ORF type:complete len:200 (-),score=6.87 TRINITY_DN2632_c0_g1_i6:51-650(-)